MNEPVRCAVLSMAHVHAESYVAALRAQPETRLLAIWDEDITRGQQAAAQYAVPFEADLTALLTRSDLEAVVITAENARHRSLCEAACREGKHVLCEKPLATNAEDAEAMIAAAAKAGVTLATAFPMRHSLPAQGAKASLVAGAIGEVLAVRSTNRGKVPPGWFLDPALAGGGAVLDHTVHVLDLLRWYLEDEPEEVYAEVSHGLFGLAVEDAAFMTITFRSGVVVTLDPSWSRPVSFPTWGDLTMEFAGTLGTLQLNATGQKVTFFPQDDRQPEWLDWGKDANAAMIADFAQAVRTGRPPAANGRDGERALAVALAAYSSARSGLPEPIRAPETM